MLYLNFGSPRVYISQHFTVDEEKKLQMKMATKFVVVLLAALTVVTACSEKQKRQSGTPDFQELFNQFQEQMKPITGQFPSLPNGFGSFPSLPGMNGGSVENSGGSYQYKRQVDPSTFKEWFNKIQEGGNNFSGNLPFKPSFGQFPFPGSSSESSESSNN